MNNILPSRNDRRFGTLLGWDPIRLFDDLMTWQPPGSEVVWPTPRLPISVAQTDDGAHVTVDMPGVDPQDLELTFEAGTLRIAGKRGDEVYRYRVALGELIDPGSIEAQLDKGVLTVHAAKRPEAKPRRIAVATGQRSLESGQPKP